MSLPYSVNGTHYYIGVALSLLGCTRCLRALRAVGIGVAQVVKVALWRLVIWIDKQRLVIGLSTFCNGEVSRAREAGARAGAHLSSLSKRRVRLASRR